MVRNALKTLEKLRKHPPKTKCKLNFPVWRNYLLQHAEGELLYQWISEGFPLGIEINQEEVAKLHQSQQVWADTLDQIHTMVNLLVKEVQRGYLIPVDTAPLYNIALFCTEKKDAEGLWLLWRMVRHASFHKRSTRAINEFIAQKYKSLRKLPNLLDYVRFLTGKYYMALRDLKDAFRQILMAIKDRKFLGYKIFGKYYVDGRQPYGVGSAAHNCQEFALLIIWILEHFHAPKELVDAIRVHIDDFTIAAVSKEAVMFLENVFDKLLRQLGVVDSPAKAVACTQSGVCYGFHWDLKEQSVGIPEAKRLRLENTLRQIIKYRAVTVKCLESVCGKIMHWSQLHKCSKSLCWNMLGHIYEEIRSKTRKPNHIILLPIRIIRDLKIWLEHCQYLGSIPFAHFSPNPSIDVWASTDASGKMGGVSVANEWLKYSFEGVHKQWSINVKEAHAVIMLLWNWRHQLQGRRVFIYVDNQSVQHAIARKWCRSRKLMVLIYEICLLMMEFRIAIWVDYIPSEANLLADALSRNRMDLFRRTMAQLGVDPVEKSGVTYFKNFRLKHQRMDEVLEFERFRKWFAATKREPAWWR